MEYTYKTEWGAILDNDTRVLHVVEGTPGLTTFPQEVIWDIHKTTPGKVFELTHTHPPGMTALSHEDETTLKAWCIAFYPYPMRMSTITRVNEQFVYTEYLGLLESKSAWLARGKQGERTFSIIEEIRQVLQPFMNERGAFAKYLIEKSYIGS